MVAATGRTVRPLRELRCRAFSRLATIAAARDPSRGCAVALPGREVTRPRPEHAALAGAPAHPCPAHADAEPDPAAWFDTRCPCGCETGAPPGGATARTGPALLLVMPAPLLRARSRRLPRALATPRPSSPSLARAGPPPDRLTGSVHPERAGARGRDVNPRDRGSHARTAHRSDRSRSLAMAAAPRRRRASPEHETLVVEGRRDPELERDQATRRRSRRSAAHWAASR